MFHVSSKMRISSNENLSNFCVNDSLAIGKWVSLRRHYIFNIFSLCCCCFSILKYYIYPRIFSSKKKKQLCLGELCQRVPDLRLKRNFDYIDLNICQICYMPSTLWNSDRNSILEIFCLHLMYLLFERCIKGLILVSVLHVFLFALGLPFCLVYSCAVCSNLYWHCWVHIY